MVAGLLAASVSGNVCAPSSRVWQSDFHETFACYESGFQEASKSKALTHR